MRLRFSFAAVFLLLVLVSAYLGFADVTLPVPDKLMHFVAFFGLTTAFYWIVETSRRRAMHATLVVCTGIGGIGSEFLQDFLPYRDFDALDILANIAGSVTALGGSAFYHRRMLDRKRAARSQYQAVALNENDTGGEGGQGAIEYIGHAVEDVDETELQTQPPAPISLPSDQSNKPHDADSAV